MPLFLEYLIDAYPNIAKSSIGSNKYEFLREEFKPFMFECFVSVDSDSS